MEEQTKYVHVAVTQGTKVYVLLYPRVIIPQPAPAIAL